MKTRLLLHVVLGLFAIRLAAAQADAWRESAQARAQLHLYRAQLAERLFTLDTTPQAEQLAALKAHAAATNNIPVPPSRGLLLDAYIAQNDGAPQPFYRYLPTTWKPGQPLPLLVYLHGFVPSYSHLDVPALPSAFTNLAERAGIAIAVPFGRSNTDFQGVGEQDVFNVIEHMRLRYNIATNRVVLAGYSMGGMGAWQIAGRWPDRFRGFLAVGNRGDFYAWHGVEPATIPPWQRRMIDTQFAAEYADNLGAMPILAIHGTDDLLMPQHEAHAIFNRVKSNPNARLILIPNTAHNELGAQFTNAAVHAWIAGQLTNSIPPNPKIPKSPTRVGATGSRAQDLFLDPFVIVGDASENAVNAFIQWYAFTGSPPRLAPENALTPEHLKQFSLLLPSTPEDSPLVARLLKEHGATVTADTLTIAGRAFPRENRGFWIAAKSPENPSLTWLANFGVPWGQKLWPNHYYDRIPDFICYTAETGAFDLPVPEGVAFLDADGKLEWSDPPATPFSQNPMIPAF